MTAHRGRGRARPRHDQVKALVRVAAGPARSWRATPWTTVDRGTETTRTACSGSRSTCWAVRCRPPKGGRVRVLGVGVAGLGESGVLLDAAGEPCAPVVAWFDQRGARGASSWPAGRGRRSSSRAGPACRGTPGQPGQAAVAAEHRPRADPAHLGERARVGRLQLGGDLVREPSLASRTGLVDQATGQLWQEGVSAAGLPATLLPRPAGRAARRLPAVRGLPPALRAPP